MSILIRRSLTFFTLTIVILALGSPMSLPAVAASKTTLFNDNFDADPAIAGPVLSWNNPAGATNYEPPLSLSHYHKYQKNLHNLYLPASSSGCTQNTRWTIDSKTVKSRRGSLAGTYYIAADLNLGGYGTNNWNFVPSIFSPIDGELGITQGEVSVIVSPPNNAITLTVSENRTAIGMSTGGYDAIRFFRIFITTTSGAEATGSDYFNETYSNGGVTFTVYNVTTASHGTHGVGLIDQCDPWPGPAGYELAPNSIFVVTSERSHSGSNSLLMGVSDDGFDKTSTSVRLIPSVIPYPSLNLLQFSYAVWLSGSDVNHGMCFNANNSTSSPILFVAGDVLTYRCNQAGSAGVWRNVETFEGNYYMAPEQWHVISVVFDLSVPEGTFYDLRIDGVEPSWITHGAHPLRGTPAQFSTYLIDSTGNWTFAWWASTQGITNLSRKTAGDSNGAYIYVDDIAISLLPNLLNSTISSSIIIAPSATGYDDRINEINSIFG